MSIVVIGRRSYLGGIFSDHLTPYDFTQTVSLAELGELSIHDSDVIINCAFSPDWYSSDLPDDLGFDGTAAAIAKRTGARYVMISTRAVYETRLEPPLNEAEPIAPSTLYGRNKARIESGLSQMLGERLLILRLANVFGAEPTGRRTFVSTALTSLARSETVELDIAARTRKDFVPSWFVGKALVALIGRRARGIFNIGSGVALEIGQVADALIRGFGRGAVRQTGDHVGDEFRLDVAKLHSATSLSLTAETIFLDLESAAKTCRFQANRQ